MAEDGPGQGGEGGEDLGIASFLEEFSEEDEGAAQAQDGLELDDVQSVEIRNIFLTTLPQYLEPAEEMLAQLFSGDAPDEQLRSTLLKALESIHTAAARIGVDDAALRIDRVCDRLSQLGADLGASATLKQDIDEELRELRRLSASAGADPAVGLGAPGEGGARSRTLFAALSGVEGIDGSVLERLTSAGLVTVEQLGMAALDEVTAVSGLDAATVKRVMAAVGLDGGDGIAPRDLSGPPEPAGLEASLERRLRARVDVEASIEELRAQIHARGHEERRLRQAQGSARARREELRATVAAGEVEVFGALEVVHGLRARRAELSARRATLGREREHLEARLSLLRRAQREAEREHSRFAEELASLRERLQRLLRALPD